MSQIRASVLGVAGPPAEFGAKLAQMSGGAESGVAAYDFLTTIYSGEGRDETITAFIRNRPQMEAQVVARILRAGASGDIGEALAARIADLEPVHQTQVMRLPYAEVAQTIREMATAHTTPVDMRVAWSKGTAFERAAVWADEKVDPKLRSAAAEGLAQVVADTGEVDEAVVAMMCETMGRQAVSEYFGDEAIPSTLRHRVQLTEAMCATAAEKAAAVTGWHRLGFRSGSSQPVLRQRSR